jgi:hypothetical protein
MKPKFILCLALVLGIAFIFRAMLPPTARQVVRRMSDYYDGLTSFEGVNTRVSQSSTYQMTNEAQFTFLRPNRFALVLDGTNGLQFYCDGTNFYSYEPYYYNSYITEAAPARFEEVLTNWEGGELLHMILTTNRFTYVMNGFGRGLVALKYKGHETINGVDCDHLYFQEPQSKIMELWVARGKSPYAAKYTFSFPVPHATNQTMHFTEAMSAWSGNCNPAPSAFMFAPSNGAVERAPGAVTVQVSETTTNGVQKQVVKLVSVTETDKAKNMAEFYKKNQEHFQAIALKSILAKYQDLTADALTFVGLDDSSFTVTDQPIVVTFALSKTIKTNETAHSLETREDTVSATITPDGNVIKVARGNTFSFHSK